jgi:hypothetical protein
MKATTPDCNHWIYRERAFGIYSGLFHSYGNYDQETRNAEYTKKGRSGGGLYGYASLEGR